MKRAALEAVSWARERIDVFGVATDGQIVHKAWDGSQWRPTQAVWELHGGMFAGRPAVASWGEGRLDVFGTSVGGTLLHQAFDAGWRPAPRTWESLGGNSLGEPAVVAWGPNRLDVFVIAGTGRMLHKAWAGEWLPSPTGWEDLGGSLTGRPAAVSWEPGRIDVFAVGTDGALQHKAWDGVAWRPSPSDWADLGGSLQGSPAAVSWGPGRLDVFVVSASGEMLHKAFAGDAWQPSITGWESQGGVFSSTPAVVSWDENRIDVFGVGPGDALYHKAWDGSGWHPSTVEWETQHGILTREVAAVSWGADRIDVFGIGTDGQTYHKAWDGTAWRPETIDWEPQGGSFIVPPDQPGAVERWLEANPRVRAAIDWEVDDGSPESIFLSYQRWTPQMRADLEAAHVRASTGSPTLLEDPPRNIVDLADGDPVRTVLSAPDAWSHYVETLGQCLANEIGGRYAWALTALSDDDLASLVSGSHRFARARELDGYDVAALEGEALAAPPDYLQSFLADNSLIGASRLETIGRLLDWSRQHLRHAMTYFDLEPTKQVEAVWQYRGLPPVSRMIEGTVPTPDPDRGLRSWTAGCHGTYGFLRSVLRVANIPVRRVTMCGHAQPFFSSEGRFLSHGDDGNWNAWLSSARFPATDLLIDAVVYEAWFGAGVSEDERCRNVGRRVLDLLIEHLPDPLLGDYCLDLRDGRSHADGRVLQRFQSVYSLTYLEESVRLWARMDEKIDALGGCDALI